MSILDEIVGHKREEVAARKTAVPRSALVARCAVLSPPRDFERALAPVRGRARLVAEVKRASPSRGVLKDDLDPVALASTYARYGADAISVLTDTKYFRGSLDDLAAVREAVDVPVLRKDFVLDEYEILRLNGVVDGYGVGTSIANAPVVSFALDIMEIEGRPMAKRGKWSGAKEVFRRRGTLETVVLPAGTTPPSAGPWDALLKPLTKGGRIVRDLPPPRTIRDYVLEQLEPVSLDTLRRSAQRRDF